MKLIPTLTVAAFLTAGAAFAASSDAKPTATPAATAVPAQKHSGGMHCEKQAKEKKLTGDEHDKFVKDCRAGKKPD